MSDNLTPIQRLENLGRRVLTMMDSGRYARTPLDNHPGSEVASLLNPGASASGDNSEGGEKEYKDNAPTTSNRTPSTGSESVQQQLFYQQQQQQVQQQQHQQQAQQQQVQQQQQQQQQHLQQQHHAPPTPSL